MKNIISFPEDSSGYEKKAIRQLTDHFLRKTIINYYEASSLNCIVKFDTNTGL